MYKRQIPISRIPANKFAEPPGISLEEQLEASIAMVENRRYSNQEKKMPMINEKLQLSLNVWEQIALKYTDGRDMENEYGQSVMFSLTDGRVMFVPMLCAAKIRALGLKPGERLDIRKAEVRNGGPRPHIEWEVKRVDAPAGPQADGTYVVPKEKETATASPVAAPATAIAQPAISNNTTSPNGNSPFEHSGHAALVRDTTYMLLDILATCKSYSAKYGGALTGDDVRACMLSSYINVAKGGR